MKRLRQAAKRHMPAAYHALGGSGAHLLLEAVARDHTSQVSEDNLHCDANAALRGTSNVVAVPGDTGGHVGIDTNSSKERSSVFDMGSLRCEQHEETSHPVTRQLGAV